MTKRDVFTGGTLPPVRDTVGKIGFVNKLCNVSAEKFKVATFTVSDICKVKVLLK